MFETQTSVAVSGSHVVAVWLAFFQTGPAKIGYAVSEDDGTSWTAPAYVESPGGRLTSNPVVAADGQGVVTLAWLGFRLDGGDPDEHVYVSTMASGASVFGAPVVASDDGTSTTRDFDKPDLAIDANDDVLLTWSDFTNSANPALTFARSTDGVTFTKTTVVADATFGNLASLCFDRSLGPTAPLYMVHLAAGATLSLRKSIDQGATWQLQPALPATDVVFQDPTCAVKGSNVTIAYASGTSGFNPSTDNPGDEIDVLQSTNGGTSFGAPAAVTDSSASSQYLFPKLALAASGKLEIVYYEGVVDMPVTFVQASSSNGTSWTRSPIGSAGTLSIDLSLASWLGGYVGLALDGTNALATYAENTQNVSHIAFAKAAIP